MLKLALLRWYDICSSSTENNEEEEQDDTELYGCKRLYLTDHYTCVFLDSIDITAHIIPRYGKNNEYLLNKYIF